MAADVGETRASFAAYGSPSRASPTVAERDGDPSTPRRRGRWPGSSVVRPAGRPPPRRRSGPRPDQPLVLAPALCHRRRTPAARRPAGYPSVGRDPRSGVTRWAPSERPSPGPGECAAPRSARSRPAGSDPQKLPGGAHQRHALAGTGTLRGGRPRGTGLASTSRQACRDSKNPDTVDSRRRTMLADTTAGSPATSSGWMAPPARGRLVRSAGDEPPARGPPRPPTAAPRPCRRRPSGRSLPPIPCSAGSAPAGTPGTDPPAAPRPRAPVRARVAATQWASRVVASRRRAWAVSTVEPGYAVSGHGVAELDGSRHPPGG